MNGDTRQVCFVIMGFGKKTDFESGRTLDLDATYDAIIKPAVTDQGLRCIRADEIMHSGVIDTPMFEMLLRADLVIADISTGNVNAVYELGVRHALRPNSTIIMKESQGRLYFDLNHVNTFKYQHLGEDIGNKEAIRGRRDLGTLIKHVIAATTPDSPVYTYLPKLQRPRLTEEEYAELLDQAESAQDRLAELIRAGEQASRESRHEDAARSFAAAAEIKPGEPYIVQQLALSTYKSAQPSELSALREGLRIINQLAPDKSNDPETLGITGAIYKRLWLITQDRRQLDQAIRYYGRGFEVRRDYYTGENLATCLDYGSAVQDDPAESQWDRMTARKVRQSLITLLFPLINSPDFQERSDRRWIYATLANASFALGMTTEGSDYELKFFAESPAQWEIDTYNGGKQAALKTADTNL